MFQNPIERGFLQSKLTRICLGNYLFPNVIRKFADLKKNFQSVLPFKKKRKVCMVLCIGATKNMISFRLAIGVLVVLKKWFVTPSKFLVVTKKNFLFLFYLRQNRKNFVTAKFVWHGTRILHSCFLDATRVFSCIERKTTRTRHFSRFCCCLHH